MWWSVNNDGRNIADQQDLSNSRKKIKYMDFCFRILNRKRKRWQGFQMCIDVKSFASRANVFRFHMKV